jgi:hypothetical protein
MEVIRPDEEPVLKTGGGDTSLVSSSLTASAFEVYGLIVQQENASSARWPVFIRDSASAILGESTYLKQSRGPTARHLAHIQRMMVQLRPGLFRLGTPIGRAARLKPATEHG